MVSRNLTCDLFCRVIDNFGDAGVAWRLARSLSRENGWRVRLIIDDTVTLSKIVPEVTAGKTNQEACGILVDIWDEASAMLRDGSAGKSAADIVIEAFSCFLPADYEAAIAARFEAGDKVAVYALDYLTAEKWAEESHGLVSPHPRYGYQKYFFFPGFTPKSGGVIYEKDLESEQDAFAADPEGRKEVLRSIGADPSHPFTLFVFTYPTVPLADFAEALKADTRPVQLVLAPGEAGNTLETLLTGVPHISIVRSPMVAQCDFDRLIASMDAAVVRGEDSTVRAQLSGIPFVWTLYPQDEGTHLVKMKAFEDLLPPFYSEKALAARLALEGSLNDAHLAPATWKHWRDMLPELTEGARAWRKHLFSETSLTLRLTQNVDLRLK